MNIVQDAIKETEMKKAAKDNTNAARVFHKIIRKLEDKKFKVCGDFVIVHIWFGSDCNLVRLNEKLSHYGYTVLGSSDWFFGGTDFHITSK